MTVQRNASYTIEPAGLSNYDRIGDARAIVRILGAILHVYSVFLGSQDFYGILDARSGEVVRSYVVPSIVL